VKVRPAHIAIVAIGCLAPAGMILAQGVQEIVVEAAQTPAAPQTGPGSRERLPVVSVDWRVNYSDLDLSTHSGATELQNRIRTSATQACQQLARLYPNSTEARGGCVDNAVKKAMDQANKAIADAEKARK
jgi:UrcA family protein